MRRRHLLQHETTDVSPSESIDDRRRRGSATVGQNTTAQYKGRPCAAGGIAENAERPPSPRRSRNGTRYGQPTPCGRSCCPRGPDMAPRQPCRMSWSCSPCSVQMLSSLSISSCITPLQALMHSTRSLCPIFVIQTPEYQMGPAADSRVADQGTWHWDFMGCAQGGGAPLHFGAFSLQGMHCN